MRINVTPVILCGGSGTRLWPLSRRTFPKQFSRFENELSLFQLSCKRLSQINLEKISGNNVKLLDPIIISANEYRFIIIEQLKEIGISPQAIILEPEPRNTGPAMLAGSLFAQSLPGNDILIFCPSDHFIESELEYTRAIIASLELVDGDNLVNFGVPASYPATGFGYIKLKDFDGTDIAYDAEEFIEKPAIDKASEMVNTEGYFWNAGIFVGKYSAFLKAFEIHSASLNNNVEQAVEKAVRDLDFYRLDTDAWQKCEDISIDYAIMERTNNLKTVILNTDWHDLGDWKAIWEISKKDTENVVTTGNALALHCENVLLRSDNSNSMLVGLGLKNVVAVAMSDAILVTSIDHSQDVKQIVPILRSNEVEQSENYPIDYRPWGWFEKLIDGRGYKVKRIHVNPGGKLSLQSHLHRSEHWVVVNGEAKVTVGDDIRFIGEGESIFVPKGAIHRMENLSCEPMVLIEVQTGSYLGEDDITRYEDIYSRQ